MGASSFPVRQRHLHHHHRFIILFSYWRHILRLLSILIVLISTTTTTTTTLTPIFSRIDEKDDPFIHVNASYLAGGREDDTHSTNPRLPPPPIAATTTIATSTQQQYRNRTTFYNSYVPSDMEGRSRAMNIVRQQLGELKRSSIWNSSFHQLFYSVIGPTNITSEIENECNDDQNHSSCHVLQVVSKGDEAVTLQPLYDYCQTAPPDTLVTYIHDKGSYHPTKENDDLRTLGTNAVFSDECQTIGMGLGIMVEGEEKNNVNNDNNDDSISSSGRYCDACGARFSPFAYRQMTGNMWTATCSYIRKLHQPDRFAYKMENLMKHVFKYAIYPKDIPKPTRHQRRKQWYTGTGRFALEHWITSHPTFRPCDVYPPIEFQYGYKNLPDSSTATSWIPVLRHAPRFPSTDLTLTTTKWSGNGTWHCGKGQLLEFQFLYGELPPKDNFIWSLYQEAFGTCHEPLNYEQHKSAFANLSQVFF